MTPTEHKNYAKDLLLSLLDDQAEAAILSFTPDPTQSRNAAKAMTAILCHRLFKKTRHQPKHTGGTTYEWKDGIFNCRNIADRGYLWTNIRRNVANEMHDTAELKAVAYLLACSSPSDATLSVWAIPEPLLYDSLSALPLKEGGQEYTIQIRTDQQRIEHCAASPDLTDHFRQFALSQQELFILQQSREIDASVRRERAIAREDKDHVPDDVDGDSGVETVTSTILARAVQQFPEEAIFDPKDIIDARERVLSTIVRRRGQPAFRDQLLAAYNGRCAITGCNVEAVLEAAHIVPYRGKGTNHRVNGLLLRADMHTLFDLRLVAVDEASMTLLVSPELASTSYGEYHGMPISLPNNDESQPSREALKQHRQESGL